MTLIEDQHWQKAFAAPDDSLREGYWVLRACIRFAIDDLREWLGYSRKEDNREL